MGIGFSELVVVFILAVLLLGPDKVPPLFRSLSLYYRKFKASWYHIQDDLERELRLDEMKKHPSQQALSQENLSQQTLPQQNLSAQASVSQLSSDKSASATASDHPNTHPH